MNKNGNLDYEEKIRARIATLKEQREKFVEQANREISAMNGAITELEALLNPEPEESKVELGDK